MFSRLRKKNIIMKKMLIYLNLLKLNKDTNFEKYNS